MQKIYKDLQSGAFYIFLAKYSNVIFQLIITGILARLISPEAFGVIAISMVFVLFFSQLSDVGVATAIVQKKSVSKTDLSTYFNLSFLQGIILTTVFLLIIPFINSFYEIDELDKVLYVLSPSILFFSLGTVPNAILRKQKKFKIIGAITVLSNIVTGVIAICFAYFHSEKIFALVIKIVLDAILFFLLSIRVSKYSPDRQFSKDSIKVIFSYSLYQFFYSLLHYFSRNVDNLIMGKYLGAAPLGYYDKAYRLMVMPVQNLSNVISPVLHPVLSSFQDDQASVIRVYRNVVKLLSLIGFPLSVFLYFSAAEIITIVFGPNWQESIIPFKYLSLSIGFQMVISSSRSIFQTANQTKALFFSSLLSIAILIALLTWGIYNSCSLNELSLLVLIHYISSFFLIFYILIHIVLKDNFLFFLKTFLNPILIALALGLGFYLVPIKLENIFLSVGVKSFYFMLIYLIVSSLLREKFLLNSLRQIIANFRA